MKQKKTENRPPLPNKNERLRIIGDWEEKKLIQELKELFKRMYPHARVEITHGPNEFGKDIVVIEKKPHGTFCIAHVIKAGEISGKVKGKVDEIKTQIDQCFKHPIEIDQKDYNTNMVIVLVGGRITTNAKKRIEREIKNWYKNQVRIFDRAKLDEWFTEFYPEVYTAGRKLSFIENLVRELEDSTFLSKKNLILSESFIEPWVSEIDYRDIENFSYVIQKNRQPFGQLRNIVSTAGTKKILIVGDPGSGKTMALYKIAIEQLNKAKQEIYKKGRGNKVRIPLLIKATHLEEIQDISSLISKYLPDLTEGDGEYEFSTLMVDGLDEVSVEKRGLLMEKAAKFSEEMGTSLILSSRKIDIVRENVPGFKKYEILPFEYSQAIKLFEKIIGDKKRDLLENLRRSLKEFYPKIERTPLALILLIDVVEQYNEIPASLSELYKQFVELVIGKMDIEKGIESLFESKVKEQFLKKLAYRITEEGLFELEKDEFTTFVNQYKNDYWPDLKEQEFLQEIKRTGLLTIGETIAFKHQSFRDYFTAQYLLEQPSLDATNLAEKYFSESWEGVLPFYFGLIGEIDYSIIKSIMEADKKDINTYFAKLFIGELLQAAWQSSNAVKKYGVERAAQFISPLHNMLKDLLKNNIPNYPYVILSDILVASIFEMSFKSTFLEKQVISTLDDYLNKNRRTKADKEQIKEDIYSAYCLLMAIKDEKEVKERVDKILELLSDTHDPILETRILHLLISITDGNLKRSIIKKLEKCIKKNPAVRKLFPTRIIKGVKS